MNDPCYAAERRPRTGRHEVTEHPPGHLRRPPLPNCSPSKAAPEVRSKAVSDARRVGRAVSSAAAGALITRGDGEVLLVQHARSRTWVLPGGKAEWGEPPAATCAREVAEELGVPATVGRLLVYNWMTIRAELFPGAAASEHAYPCHVFTFHATLAPEAQERIRTPERELLGWRWWDLEEACAPGVMEPYNARNLRAAHTAWREDRGAAYLES